MDDIRIEGIIQSADIGNQNKTIYSNNVLSAAIDSRYASLYNPEVMFINMEENGDESDDRVEER